jgi:hypothetical protein
MKTSTLPALPTRTPVLPAVPTHDPWEAFFAACWDAYDEVMVRRRAQAQVATLPQDEDDIQANSLQTK